MAHMSKFGALYGRPHATHSSLLLVHPLYPVPRVSRGAFGSAKICVELSRRDRTLLFIADLAKTQVESSKVVLFLAIR